MPFVTPDLPETEAAIVALTNTFRAENHLGAVTSNPALQAAARQFAAYLARTSTFDHTADGRQPSDRVKTAGYRACIVAENLALQQSSSGFEARVLAGRAVEGWKNSPPHRANMLQPEVTETGIGIAFSKDAVPKFLSVQVFGRPDSLKVEFKIENQAGIAVGYMLDGATRQVSHRAVITHTACAPQPITFATGAVTTAFATRNGAAFLITRGPDGKPRVEMQLASAGTAVKPAR